MIKRVAKIVFSLALLAILIWLAHPVELLRTFALLSWPILLLSLFISFLLVLVSVLKWRLFIGADAPGVWYLYRLYLIGYFVNLVLPSYVGGDATRSFFVGRKGVGHVNAASATILERYTGLVAMFGMAVLSSFVLARYSSASSLVSWKMRLAVISLALGLAVMTALALSPKLLAILTRLPLLNKTKEPLVKVQKALTIALKQPVLMQKALALSLIYHCVTVVNTIVAGAAFGWLDVHFIDLLVVVPLILTIGSLPLTPGGLGLQEGAFVFFLTALGATTPQALAIGILLRAKGYLLALLGWGAWVWEGRGETTRGGSQRLSIRTSEEL